ncbi:thioredoxin-dependent thiol peroxidase [Patescibacteria group bacterium]|nr:thioredoxin-dependent thiol peroxidase [Patescibacteria group bacterium]MBU1500737.1 thioredoxin-dependent thiol peroxidase [Patescibacteria group bacterium]MBU2080792.1 thioredoxin-dependent thiol peroxidase [Patescibacteria group bacterium]MBU2123897.1 thioredoxin-dependent thiol peroxidase [Patescibacteria group bacterium]MBU2194812.1 thioredoxin-dependent thiol peroxidase [Patescibacteria group bacterium]
MAHPSVGSLAPDFTLLDQDGAPHTLSSYRGSPVLIYFYPKDDTPGCTKEACSIRDAFPSFAKSKMVVLGISPDSVESHKKFALKYSLPFTLLADPEKDVISTYDVWGKKKFMGREYDGVFRTSFLINPEGYVEKIYENVRPEEHAAEVLQDVVHG